MRIGLIDRLSARVTGLQTGPVSVQVHLTLAAGDRLHAVVTRDSAAALALAPGAAVLALPLAPGVLLSTGGNAPAAETRWPAVVEQLAPGPLNTVVRLRSARGTRLHAVLTQSAAVELGLTPGAAVDVGILASQVVLAMPGDAVSAPAASAAAASVRAR